METNANAQTTSSADANTEVVANTSTEQVTASTEVKPTEETVKPVESKDEQKVEPKFELKLSDNSILDSKHMDNVVTYAKENGLTPEQAQNLLNREEATFKQAIDEHNNAIARAKEEWKQQSLADKEFGGPDFNKNVEMAHRVLDKFGNDSVKKFLDESGMGNHPDVLRMFVRLGKATSEDRIINPNVQGGSKKSLEDVFYGETKN